MSKWKIKKQREIDALKAENELLRQSGQMKPSDLSAVSAPGWAWAANPADGVKRIYSGVTCYTCRQKGHIRLFAGRRARRRQHRPLMGQKEGLRRNRWLATSVRNCSSKVSPVTEAAKAPAKSNQASSCGTLGYHTKETDLEIQVN